MIGGAESLKIKEADGTRFIKNTFVNATTIRFDNATETLMSGNTGLDDVELKVINGACFDGNSNDDDGDSDGGGDSDDGDSDDGDSDDGDSHDDGDSDDKFIPVCS